MIRRKERLFFQSECDRIYPEGTIDYNTRRDKSTPLWNLIVEMFGKKKWKELLSIAEREIKKEIKQKECSREKLVVKSYSDIDW